MLYWLSGYCIKTIIISFYIKWWYCSWPVAPAQCCFLFVFCLLYDSIICGQFIFYLGGQSVSCKASLAALRLYGYFCDIVVMMLLSENKMMMTMKYFGVFHSH